MLNTKHPMGAWADEMPPVNLTNYPMKDYFNRVAPVNSNGDYIKGMVETGQAIVVDPLNPATWPNQAEAKVATTPIKDVPSAFDKQSQSAFDIQVGGGHYKNYKIQPLEYVMANNLNFAQGNVVKYVTRYKEKNGIEDLKKARHYIDMLIELESKERAGISRL